MDGAKPTMILPAATKQMISKGLFDSGSDKSDTSHKENSEMKMKQLMTVDSAIENLKKTWKSLLPLVTESSTFGKVVCCHLHDQNE